MNVFSKIEFRFRGVLLSIICWGRLFVLEKSCKVIVDEFRFIIRSSSSFVYVMLSWVWVWLFMIIVFWFDWFVMVRLDGWVRVWSMIMVLVPSPVWMVWFWGEVIMVLSPFWEFMVGVVEWMICDWLVIVGVFW